MEWGFGFGWVDEEEGCVWVGWFGMVGESVAADAVLLVVVVVVVEIARLLDLNVLVGPVPRTSLIFFPRFVTLPSDAAFGGMCAGELKITEPRVSAPTLLQKGSRSVRLVGLLGEMRLYDECA